MTTINKMQTDYLVNKYSQDKSHQVNSINTDFTMQINSNIEPTDISFDDYKKLTYDALETIFNGDSEKIGIASELLGSAKLTNDDVLNKIYFDNTSDKYFQTLGIIAIMNFKIDENNDAFLPNDSTSLAKIGQSNKSNTTS
ncbi:MAG: hypothetical protein KA157_06800 [Aliarcobacter sp.]|jgi:hypothetical protein|nr:hypothetical protein [Aliarcobacter sp.]